MKRKFCAELRNQEKTSVHKGFLVILTLLIVAVMSSMTILGDRLAIHATKEEAVIALTASSRMEEVEQRKEAKRTNLDKNLSSDKLKFGRTSYTVLQEKGSRKVWNSQTDLGILRISYKNGERYITAAGETNAKIIAPGTVKEYTFQMQNTEDVSMDYSMTAEARILPLSTDVPLQIRVKRADGKYLIGGADDWVPLKSIDAVKGKATLDVGKLDNYTLQWRWPFESGNDAHDTALGNEAKTQEITMSITIKTIATPTPAQGENSESTKQNNSGNSIKLEESYNPMHPSQDSDPSQTGDTGFAPYVVVALIALFVIVLLIVVRRIKDEEGADSES